MSKLKMWIGVILLVISVAACSNNEQDTGDSSSEGEASSDTSTEQAELSNGLSEAPEQEKAEQDTSQAIPENNEDKMMVYEAHIRLETDDYDQFNQMLEKKMDETDAYMVETNIHKTERGNRQGQIRLRVPQKNFETLLTSFEEISDNILSRNISGRDVTKEYVDLESRLEAKQKVESRLLTFLEQAEKTEDLIKISQDLERVQSEIETIKGQMNYLQNQSDFSTITLSIEETKVVVPKVDNQQLNTWEKTKKAFFSSINGLASFFSWLTVAILGYSPILLILLAVGISFWWIRKRKKQSNSD